MSWFIVAAAAWAALTVFAIALAAAAGRADRRSARSVPVARYEPVPPAAPSRFARAEDRPRILA